MDYYDRSAMQSGGLGLDRELVHIVGLTRYLSVIVRNYVAHQKAGYLEAYRRAANVSFDYLGQHASQPDFRTACKAMKNEMADWALS